MNNKKDVSDRFISMINELLNRGLTPDKKAFAQAIGCSTSMITEIYKGRSNVGVSVLQNVVQTYNVSATWLLTGEGEMFTTNQEVELHKSSEEALTCNLLDLIRQKDEIIRQQAKDIGRLEQALERCTTEKGLACLRCPHRGYCRCRLTPSIRIGTKPKDAGM